MCLKGITKFLIAFTNGFFLIIGLGLLVGGAIVYSNAAQYGVPIDVAIGVIVTGGIVFLISFLGCYGAKWENRWMLYAYCLIIILLIAGEIAFVALAFSQSQVIDDTLSSSWEKMSDTDKTIVQNSLGCCGFENNTDRAAYPCPTNYEGGCFVQLHNQIETYFAYVKAAGIVLITIEFIMALLTFFLACHLQKKVNKRANEKKELEQAREINRQVLDASGKK